MKTEIDLDNLTAEEQEIAKRLSEKKKPYWVPKNGEPFWYINNVGDAECSCFDYSISEHRFYLAIGNYFKTEEEAKEAMTRMQMQTKWKRLSLEAGEADNPWDGKHKHVFTFWDYLNETLDIDFNEVCFSEKTYFPTADSIKAAIAELGEENVKKYILGVNDGRRLQL